LNAFGLHNTFDIFDINYNIILLFNVEYLNLFYCFVFQRNIPRNDDTILGFFYVRRNFDRVVAGDKLNTSLIVVGCIVQHSSHNVGHDFLLFVFGGL